MKQKALPMMVLRKFHEIASSDRDQALASLFIGAIFFAMRSCEYLQVAAEETKRTKIIRVGKILFKKGNKIVQHSHPKLHTSDLVRIHFEMQKNDRRDVCIHMFKSGDEVLCPVRAWAATVKRVRQIEEANDESPVCMFKDSGQKITYIKSDYARSRLRSIVLLVGIESLGFSKEEVGLHSIRSGGAMAMFLSGTSVIIIMRVGRWSSEAFLEYIRDQVESFTLDVSMKMIKCEEFYSLSGTRPATDTTQNDTSKEEANENVDGPDSVPFDVRFSRLALNHTSKHRGKR